ncbi:MAG: hypothetical protein K9L30_16190 [Desulfobacterales bacterium]|nr:hypothetical protein [Desulfobacterales bacterium]
MTKKEVFDNLTIQDAITIISIYISRIDPFECELDIQHIAGLLGKNELFNESFEKTRQRINRFTNELKSTGIEEILDFAIPVLKNSQSTNSAFEAAVVIATTGGKLSEERISMLDHLIEKLALEKEFADLLVKNIPRQGIRTQ